MGIDMAAFKTEAEKKAEQFISQIKYLLRQQDDIIYSVDSSVNKSASISTGTATDRDAWVEVTMFNVSNPDNLFPAHIWVRIGELGADVDTYTGSSWNGYNPTVEIHKRISG